MTAGYSLPQGIAIDGMQHQAVPRKVGAYDTESYPQSGASTATLTFFQNATGFGTPPTTTVQVKTYGRDTNITSRTGGMAKGERLYAYGITAKWTKEDATWNTLAAIDDWAGFARHWSFCDVAVNLGADEFIRCQARDIPLMQPKIPNQAAYNNNNAGTAATFGAVFDISSEGMFDITISNDPYIFDQQEDFRLVLTRTSVGTAATPVTNWYVTFKIEGIRLKSLRQ